MSTWAPSLVADQCRIHRFPSLASLRDVTDNDSARSHDVRSGRVVEIYEAAAPGGGSVGAGAGQRPDLQLRVLRLVRLLLGEVGADDAEQEADRDRDDARVLQREPVE